MNIKDLNPDDVVDVTPPVNGSKLNLRDLDPTDIARVVTPPPRAEEGFSLPTSLADAGKRLMSHGLFRAAGDEGPAPDLAPDGRIKNIQEIAKANSKNDAPIGNLPIGAVGTAGGIAARAAATGAIGATDAYVDGANGADALKQGALQAGLSGALESAPAVAKGLYQGTKAVSRGALAGAKELSSEAPFGTKTAASAVGAAKGAYNELKQTLGDGSEWKGIANEARKVLYPGETGAVGQISDDNAVLAALMSDGDNPVKQFYAQRSATLNPGQGSSADYSKLLGMNSEDRAAARAFDPRAAAAELKPDVEQAQDLFEQARGDRYGQLQNQARETFDHSVVPNVIDHLEASIADANRLNTTKAVSPILADVYGMITEGNGLTSQGLKPGPAAEATPQEMFNRLQQARQTLDGKIRWANKEGDSQSESLLKGVRDSIDAALKTSPEKVEGDALWRQSKQLEDNFFGATEFGKKGNVNIDEGKIASLLGGSEQAKRFQDTLAQMKQFAGREDLSPEFRAKMADLVNRMQAKIGVADNQRALNSFRQKAGPSSPAIERLQSIQGGNSLLKDAANAPAGFLNSVDEFNAFIKQRTGTSFNQLPADQKLGAAKFWQWQKANQGAPQATTDKAWMRFMGGQP